MGIFDAIAPAIRFDYNKLQSLDNVSTTLALEPLRDKWESFGWQVSEISGHNHSEIFTSLTEPGLDTNKPILVIANTIKGKGVSFMENSVLWHYRSPQDIDYTNALRELGVTE